MLCCDRRGRNGVPQPVHRRMERSEFPDNTNLVNHVEKWAKVRGDKLAYRFLDFSTERDGIERDILWSEFSARNRAVGARLQQVTQPGDRIAILCPQNLDYLVSFFGALYSGRIAVPLFDPAEPGHVGRLHAVLDDCSPSTILTTTDSAEGVRKFIRARVGQGTAPRDRRRRGAHRGGRHLAAARRRRDHHRLPAVHLGLDPHPDRRADQPPEPAHQRAAGAERARGHRR